MAPTMAYAALQRHSHRRRLRESSFYKSKSWRRVRVAVLHRDGWRFGSGLSDAKGRPSSSIIFGMPSRIHTYGLTRATSSRLVSPAIFAKPDGERNGKGEADADRAGGGRCGRAQLTSAHD